VLWIALALALDPTVPAAEPQGVNAPPEATHTLTVSVKSPPGGSVVEATAFGITRELKDPGVGVHSASFIGPPSRFTRLQLSLAQGGGHTPLYDGMVPLSDADNDVVSFVVANNGRPTALRTATSPSAAVRLWTEPVTFTRYGWAALLALYAALALFASTRKA
jgi:hypothetical protein